MAISRLMNAGQAYVTLELPSGEILSGKVAVVTINIERDTPAVYSWDGNVAGRVAGPLHWSVALDGYGDMVLRQDIGVKHTGNDMDGPGSARTVGHHIHGNAISAGTA